jgi:hypothetical protein
MSQNFNGTVTTPQRAIGAKLRFDAKYLARCFMAAWDDGLGHPPRQSLTVEQVKFPPQRAAHHDHRVQLQVQPPDHHERRSMA